MKHFLRRAGSAILAAGLLLSSALAPAPAQAATCPTAYTADGRPTIAPTASGPGTGKRIGFDNTHGQTAGQADWVIDGGFSDMACALAGQGYAVEEIRAYPLTETTLGAFDVVVIPEPNIPFTTAEEGALESYVAAGGGLLLVGDHYQADRNYNTWDATEIFNGFRRGHYGETYSAPAYWYNGVQTTSTYTFNDGDDWLAGAFGFRFRFNAMDLANANIAFGPGDPTDPSDPGILPPSLTYGLTTGVNRVATYAGATLSIVDPTRAMGLIYPNQGTIKRWNNAQSNDPVALYTDNVGIPAGGAVTYGGVAEGAYVVIAKPGLGKVAAAGDSSLWEDKSPRYRREVDGSAKTTHDGWLDSDHDTLGINLVNWLATPDSAVGIDPALQQGVTPEPYSPFTISEPLNEPWTTGPAGYRWYDSRTFAAGAYNGANAGGPPVGVESWNWAPLPLKAYPNNNLAVFLDVTGLTPNRTLTSQTGIFVVNGGAQIARRYLRDSGTYSTTVGYTSVNHTIGTDGTLKRWEFFQLNANTLTSSRDVNVRAREQVGSSTTNKATSGLSQAPQNGSYGTLKVESALGYSDGLHAALFTRDGNLDTAVQILRNADTNITLPPGTYSLEIQNDTTVKRTGVSITITAGQTLSLAQVLAGGGGNPNAGFSFSSIPENAYPGNRLAIYLDGHDLAANTAYSTEAYLYETGSGLQLSRRYDRAAHAFVGALTPQSLTANASGEVHRWEFWELDPATLIREISARVRMNGTATDTQSLTQLAESSYGYLTVESTLGYSDGLHAALFRSGPTLDTAVWIASGSNTTITLPPGTYTLEVRNDTSSRLSNVTVTITAGQTLSLSQLLGGGGPTQPGWFLSQVPAHAYAGNRLALWMDAQGLTANTTYSVQGYVYVTGGLQISKRYNRATETFIDGLTAQNMTTDGTGGIHRWEFWELASAGNREINARLKVNGTNKATETLDQIASGAFGTLLIPASLGYSDGLHAALFHLGASLDTTAWIAKGADTSVKLPAGTYSLSIWNDAGVQLSSVSVTITANQTTSLLTALDSTPPTISASRAPEANEFGWTNAPVTVSFTCADSGSGVATCPDPITVTTEGEDQSVTVSATDKVGNTASLIVSGISIDLTAPVTTASAPADWAGGEVSVTLMAEDGLSGVEATYFSLDGGAAQRGTSVLVSGDGSHTISYWSVDRAGNVEAAHALTLLADATAPTITINGARAYTVNELVEITCVASDALSGLASDPCVEPLLVAPAATLALGSHTVSVTAVDLAGNEVTVSAQFSIGVSYESLASLTAQYVTKAGQADGLAKKLEQAAKAAAMGNLGARDAHLNGFIHELRGVQSSGSITAEQAATLEALVLALQS